MKSAIKSSIVIILPLVLSYSVKAQSNSFSASIEVNAEIIQAIELITISNIKLSEGEVDDDEVYVSAINNPNAGHMIAQGVANADIRIQYVPQRVLTQSNGNGILRFNYEVSGSTIDNQISSELIFNETRNLRFNQQGRFFLWVGGRVDISQAEPGNYEGQFTLEIDYI